MTSNNIHKQYESVLVIDDHKMVANGIKLLVDSWFTKFHMAYDAASAISIALQHFPKLIIVDFALPDMPGDLLVRELKYKIPNTKILAYTFSYASDVIMKMFQSGVNGYVVKKGDDDDFIKAVHALMSGRDYFCAEARTHLINKFNSTEEDYSIKHLIGNTKFSEKEIRLIQLLCRQMTTKEISSHINLSNRTVEQYRSSIIRRIGAKNLAGVIKFALQNGIIQLDEL